MNETSQTLIAELASPEAGAKPTRSLLSRRSPLAPPDAQLRRLDAVPLGDPQTFARALSDAGIPGLQPATLEIFQINLGKLCNMTCRHCHVDAGPDRTDAMMSDATVDACLRALEQTSAHTVDLTGGAPELHPRFRDIVDAASKRGLHVIDRCNLTVLLLPRFRDLPGWFGERGVEVVASLPHYRARNTDAQRGDGTYEKSIKALKILNEAGYGKGDPRRRLTLMSNPAGAFLAGNQVELERDWKAALLQNHDVTFDRLFALNNMPISRFLEWLITTDNLDGYMKRLVSRFNPATVPGLMCRNTLSISWDGRLFDCDFNQMLDIEVALPEGGVATIEALDPERLARRHIQTARHCFGCTAGSGSSCSGATT